MKYTDDELIDQIRVVTELLDGRITYEAFNTHPFTASGPTVTKRFGSWSTALETAGVKVTNPRTTYTEEELLDQIRLVADEVGRAPSVSDLDSHPETASGSVFIHRFDSIEDALVKAGVLNQGKWQWKIL